MGNEIKNLQKKIKKPRRLFYEKWGEMNLAVTGMIAAAAALFIVALVALAVSYYTYTLNRIPLVIRDKGGSAQVIHRIAFQYPAGAGEVDYFVKSFIREFQGFNSFTVRTEIPRALNKMSPDYSPLWYHYILKNKIVKTAASDDEDFRVVFKKVEIINQTAVHIVLRVILEIDVVSNATGKIERTDRYMDGVILQRIPRSKDYPFGLEVVNFTETKL